MKHKVLSLVIMCTLAPSVLLGAGTLEDAIRKAPRVAAENKVICGCMNGSVRCDVTDLSLTRVLTLPNCAFGAESYSAAEDQVLVVVQGMAHNRGSKAAFFQIPVFRSASGNEYEEEEAIRFQNSQNDLMAAKLNPGSRHRFICFFRVPVREVLGGQLVFEKEVISFDDDNETYLSLPISGNQEIKQNLSIPGVTDM